MTGSSIRIGTRGSALAMAQSGIIAAAVAKASGLEVELVPITSHGDTSTESLASLGGTGVFASALRDALLAGECDLLVHSFKDLPTADYPGLTIGSVPKRADARDAFCGRNGLTLEALPAGSRVGTGAPRRTAQLRLARPDIDVVDIRGNVDTRLGRVAEGDLDAVVLAAAGLGRLGKIGAASELFELSRWPTAPAQGALAVEALEGHSTELGAVLRAVNHGPSRMAAMAERAVLAKLQAGCSAPIGASAVLDGEMLFLSATVYADDGVRSLTSSHALVLEGTASERALLPHELGARVAEELLKNGAAELTTFGGAS
ncbi:MAG: hydroxymethylbilane synthase [Lacisediminihabitans sp.]